MRDVPDTEVQASDVTASDVTADAARGSDHLVHDGALYLFRELARGKDFCISGTAAALFDGFEAFLREKRFLDRFQQSIAALEDQPIGRFNLLRDWIDAYIGRHDPDKADYGDEVAALLLDGRFERGRVIDVAVDRQLTDMAGDHGLLDKGCYQLDYNHFVSKL